MPVQLYLDDCDAFCCPECTDEFSLEEVWEWLASREAESAAWRRALAWIAAAPAAE